VNNENKRWGPYEHCERSEPFEEMEVNDIIEEMGGESSDEDPLSDDSDCISNCSEDFTKYYR